MKDTVLRTIRDLSITFHGRRHLLFFISLGVPFCPFQLWWCTGLARKAVSNSRNSHGFPFSFFFFLFFFFCFFLSFFLPRFWHVGSQGLELLLLFFLFFLFYFYGRGREFEVVGPWTLLPKVSKSSKRIRLGIINPHVGLLIRLLSWTFWLNSTSNSTMLAFLISFFFLNLLKISTPRGNCLFILDVPNFKTYLYNKKIRTL